MEKIKVLVFKKSGKWYTTIDWTKVPDDFDPGEQKFIKVVRKMAGINDNTFHFVVIDHPDNKKFFTQLILPDITDNIQSDIYHLKTAITHNNSAIESILDLIKPIVMKHYSEASASEKEMLDKLYG